MQNALKWYATCSKKNMIVTIHQPDFLPWLGFFDRWQKSDFYIILDDVQFLRRGWHHRDKIKTSQGIKWLTIPVLKKGRYLQRINEVLIDNGKDWRHKHLTSISYAYGKSLYFQSIIEDLKKIYHHGHEKLIDLNIDLLKFCANKLGISTPMTLASSFQIDTKSNLKLLELVKAAHGDIYLTGMGSRDYLNEELFLNEGIKIRWQKFDHPIYPQLHGSFEKMLSVLDFLMMVPEQQLGHSRTFTSLISR